MNNPNKLPSLNPKAMPYLTDELNDIQEFVKDCYDNDIVWEQEPGEFIEFNALLEKFTLFYQGKMKYFDSYETAEDWLKLNQGRRNDEANAHAGDKLNGK